MGFSAVENVNVALQGRLAGLKAAVTREPYGQSSSPAIYAIGDVATFPLPDGSYTRWENWTHARHQAAVAVKHMLGKETPPYADTPWIWSDQYDYNIQVTGSPEAEQVVMRGSLEADYSSGRLTAFHLKDGKVVGATTINDSRNKSSIRKLVEKGASVAAGQLADSALDLKKLVASL